MNERVKHQKWNKILIDSLIICQFILDWLITMKTFFEFPIECLCSLDLVLNFNSHGPSIYFYSCIFEIVTWCFRYVNLLHNEGLKVIIRFKIYHFQKTYSRLFLTKISENYPLLQIIL